MRVILNILRVESVNMVLVLRFLSIVLPSLNISLVLKSFEYEIKMSTHTLDGGIL